CLCPLYFSASCAHRVLHSFPTRRSSDLVELAVRVRQDLPGDVLHEEWVLRLRRVPGSRNELEGLSFRLRRLRRCDPVDHTVEGGDRKSTRLNSSHQIISYAVFCLKKKTK